jgi:hypothetical protein
VGAPAAGRNAWATLASPNRYRSALNHRPLPYQESSHASDVLRLILELPLLSVNVHRGALAVAAVVTQLALDIPAGRPFRAENRGWLPADAA